MRLKKELKKLSRFVEFPLTNESLDSIIEGLQINSSDKVLATQFRLHLHRGIEYLAANKSIKNISTFVSMALV